MVYELVSVSWVTVGHPSRPETPGKMCKKDFSTAVVHIQSPDPWDPTAGQWEREGITRTPGMQARRQCG